MSKTSDKLKEFTAEVERDSPGWPLEQRVWYLRLMIAYYTAELGSLDEQDEGIRRRYATESDAMELLFNEDTRRELKRELKRTQGTLTALQDGREERQLVLADITHAKRYPMERLIDVGKNGMIRCINPHHEDKTPSMSIKHNRVKCFACGWSGDTIAVVMVTENLSFPQAVRRLQ